MTLLGFLVSIHVLISSRALLMQLEDFVILTLSIQLCVCMSLLSEFSSLLCLLDVPMNKAKGQKNLYIVQGLMKSNPLTLPFSGYLKNRASAPIIRITYSFNAYHLSHSRYTYQIDQSSIRPYYLQHHPFPSQVPSLPTLCPPPPPISLSFGLSKVGITCISHHACHLA